MSCIAKPDCRSEFRESSDVRPTVQPGCNDNIPSRYRYMNACRNTALGLRQSEYVWPPAAGESQPIHSPTRLIWSAYSCSEETLSRQGSTSRFSLSSLGRMKARLVFIFENILHLTKGKVD
jgi:hypothetical protein